MRTLGVYLGLLFAAYNADALLTSVQNSIVDERVHMIECAALIGVSLFKT